MGTAEVFPRNRKVLAVLDLSFTTATVIAMKTLFLVFAACLVVSSYAEEHDVDKRLIFNEFHPIQDITSVGIHYLNSVDPRKVADLLGMDSSKISWHDLGKWDGGRVDLQGLKKYLGLHHVTRKNVKIVMKEVCRIWYQQIRFTLQKHAKNIKGKVQKVLDKLYPIVQTLTDLVPVHCYSDDDCGIAQCCGHHHKYFKGHGLCTN